MLLCLSPLVLRLPQPVGAGKLLEELNIVRIGKKGQKGKKGNQYDQGNQAATGQPQQS